MIRILKFSFPLLLFLSFLSCSEENRELSVYSDVPETVEIVNLFNQTQSLYSAEFIYAAGEEMINPGIHDVVIGHSLHSYHDRMISLDDMRDTGFVSTIYPEILKAGVMGTSLQTIPLSLDIPVVLGKDLDENTKFISWDDLTALSGDFNTITEERLSKSGFSPLWSDTFLTAFFNSRISSYPYEMNENAFKGFLKASDELTTWINDTNGGLDMDLAFDSKYRYIPDYRLILNKRTAYSVIPLSEWALLPDNISRELGVKTLLFKGGLESLNTISAGIPRDSENTDGGRAFMTWLLQESTWEDYLRLTGRNRDESFAFLGGISSSERLNTGILIKEYPWMATLVPRKGEFSDHTDIQPQWEALWTDLFLPLIRERISGRDSEKDFSNEYRKWQLLHPDPWDS